MRPAKNATLGVILGDLLSQVANATLTYVVQGNQIVIIPSSRLTPSEQGGVALRESVHIDVDERPLAEALKELAAAAGANIVLDARLKEKAKVAVSASLQHVPLETAVRLLAEMADLKAVALDNVIYVTTRENAEKWQKERGEKENGPFPAPGGSGSPLPTKKDPNGA